MCFTYNLTSHCRRHVSRVQWEGVWVFYIKIFLVICHPLTNIKHNETVSKFLIPIVLLFIR